MSRYYTLKDGVVTPCDDLIKWGRWLEKANRIVECTHITSQIDVSTVFLGLDYRFSDVGQPIVFETLVFGGDFDGEMNRYTSLDAAKQGHAIMVAKVTQ